MLPVEWKTQAVKKLQEFNEEIQREIREAIDEIANQQFSHPDLKPITDKSGNWVWRLKIKRQHTDHRVLIDMEDNKFIIQDLDHRDHIYE